MSELVTALFETLSETEHPNIVDSIRKLAALPEAQREQVCKYILERTQRDMTALQDVSVVLSSGRHISIPKETYAPENPFVAFRKHLKSKSSIKMLKTDNIVCQIDHPEQDLRLVNIAKNSDIAYFDVKVTVRGYTAKTSVIINIDINNYSTKEPAEWIKDIIRECVLVLSNPVPDTIFVKVVRDNTVETFLENPSEKTVEDVRNMLYLLQETLGKPRASSLTSSIFGRKTEHMMKHLSTIYSDGQEIEPRLVNQLEGLSDVLEFTSTNDCLIVDSKFGDVSRHHEPLIFILKEGTWVRGSSTNPACERALLAEKLQQ